MKRVFKCFMLVLLCIFLVTLSACEPAVSFPSTSQAPGHTSPNDQVPLDQQITLKLWHIWATDSDSNKRPFEKALAEWNNANPNVQIMTEATENETYKIQIRTAIAVNEAPDIFYGWGAGFAKPFVESGKVLALDDYLDDATKNKLVPGSFENFTFDGKIYGLPTFMIAGIFYCNQELFNQYDVKIPKTYSELLEAIKIFKSNAITPMAVGLKDGWPGIFYQNILAIRTAGIQKSIAALNKEASFYQPEFIESAQKLKELIDAGAFSVRSMQLTQHEAELAFLNGTVAMYYGGSWAAGSMDREDSPVNGKIVVKNFPIIEGAKGDANGFLGGAIDTFMFSSSTKYKKEAVNALVSICENFCRESYLSGSGIPAWKVNVESANISPLATDISRLLEDRDGFVLAWDTFLSGTEAKTHIDLVSDIFAERLTPEEFALNMQKLNQASTAGH